MTTNLQPSSAATSLHSHVKDHDDAAASGVHTPHEHGGPTLASAGSHDIEKTTTNNKLDRSETAMTAAEQQGEGYSKVRWYLVCVALYCTGFLYGLDNTIVANIQAAIIEKFGAVEQLGWLGTGFPLGSIMVILSLGKAYGQFNVKGIYIASLLNFAGGSALCGAAPSINALIIGRVWAGAGGAGLYLGMLNIITINTTELQRPIYMALGGLMWGIGTLLGPVVGGAFADSKATWRWAFYINLVLFGLASPIFLFLLKSYQPQPGRKTSEKLRHVDWVGVILNASFFTCYVCALTFAGAQWAWKSTGVIVFFVMFGVTLAAFIIQQSFKIFTTFENRIFPVDFAKSRSLVLLYIGTACGATALFVPLYYIPLYFAFAKGETGLQSAVRLLPFVIVLVFCVMLNGALMPKFGVYQPWYVVSGVFLIVGGSLMYALVDATTSTSAVYGYSVIMAIGGGLSQQAAYSVAPIKVAMSEKKGGPSRIADAVGFINVAQIGTVVIALTISSSIFQNIGYKHVASALEGLNFSPKDIHAALAGSKSAVFTSASVTPEIREKVVAGIIKTISDSYILVIVAGGVLLITGLAMRREKLFMAPGGGGA